MKHYEVGLIMILLVHVLIIMIKTLYLKEIYLLQLNKKIGLVMIIVTIRVQTQAIIR